MRVAVTGGAGFIGSHIVDALLAAEHEVLVIDNFFTGCAANLDKAAQIAASRLRIASIDICDPQLIKEFIQFRPEAVLHHAAQVNVRISIERPDFDAQNNILGTINVLEAAYKSGAKKFVLASSCATYGDHEQLPASEDHPTDPCSPYGLSKYVGEQYLKYYARARNMHTIAMRYANVYGPRQNAKGEAGVVAIFSQRLLKEQPLQIFGDGLQTRDFIYVRDIASANLRAIHQHHPGKFSLYNVGCGQEISVLSLVAAMREQWYKIAPLEKHKIIVEHTDAIPGEMRRISLSYAKIADELGWKPQISLQDGLAETIQSFYQRNSVL